MSGGFRVTLPANPIAYRSSHHAIGLPLQEQARLPRCQAPARSDEDVSEPWFSRFAGFGRVSGDPRVRNAASLGKPLALFLLYVLLDGLA